MERASRQSSSLYRFGRCEIDAARRTLTRRGRNVKVEPRVLDLLLHLIQQRERVVSVDGLLDAVWSDVEVTANSVSQAVHKARMAIGDDASAPRAIATVRGRGYRFTATLLTEKHLGRRVSGPLHDAMDALSGGSPFPLGELLRLSDRRDRALAPEAPSEAGPSQVPFHIGDSEMVGGSARLLLLAITTVMAQIEAEWGGLNAWIAEALGPASEATTVGDAQLTGKP